MAVLILENRLNLKRVTVPIDALKIVDLNATHLAGALALSKEVYWNQALDDWSMMLEAGRAIGFEDSNGKLIASGLTLPYGNQFGWISMVIVTELWRKNGLATQLLNACIRRLEDQGLLPVLDATPAGQNVYRPLKFRPHFIFRRWEHASVETIIGNNPQNLMIHPFNKVDTQGIIATDLTVFGGDRRLVIENLIGRSSHLAAVTDDQEGFVLGRDGRAAVQIGPICANSSEAAIELLNHALAASSGPVFIDACDHQKKFTTRLREYGFRPQRPFLRMAKGRTKSFGQPEKMFAMAGPELG